MLPPVPADAEGEEADLLRAARMRAVRADEEASREEASARRARRRAGAAALHYRTLLDRRRQPTLPLTYKNPENDM